MSLSPLCSIEEFFTNWKIIEKSLVIDSYSSISSSFFALASQITTKDNSNIALSNAYKLCAHICSIQVTDSLNEPFSPVVEYSNERSSILSNFTEEQIDFVANILEFIDIPLIKARFADLLWLCIKPRKGDYARIAIDTYLSLPINHNTWFIDVKNCFIRLINLAWQIKNNDKLQQIEELLLQVFNNISSYELFNFKLSIARLIKNSKLSSNSYTILSDELLKIANRLIEENKYEEAEQHLITCEEFFKYLKKEKERFDTLILIAQCYEFSGDSKTNNILANFLYEKALKTYRMIPNSIRNELGVTKNLKNIVDKLAKSGLGSIKEMSVIESPKIDLSNMVDSSKKQVSNKECLELALLSFTLFPVDSYQNLRKDAIRLLSKHPLSSLFKGVKKAIDGRTIAQIPSLSSLNNIYENEDVIFSKMIENFHLSVGVMVKGQILPALQEISLEHRISKKFLVSLCYYSSIVPENREYLFGSALWLGFEYDFSNSIYLLMPQVEHMIRYLFKDSGLKTTNIDKYGIENENGLSALLGMEEAKEILGEDLLFEMKALFTDSLGSNLRNEVAHGLLDDDRGNTTVTVYAWWMILRIIIRSFSLLEYNKKIFKTYNLITILHNLSFSFFYI